MNFDVKRSIHALKASGSVTFYVPNCFGCVDKANAYSILMWLTHILTQYTLWIINPPVMVTCH